MASTTIAVVMMVFFHLPTDPIVRWVVVVLIGVCALFRITGICVFSDARQNADTIETTIIAGGNCGFRGRRYLGNCWFSRTCWRFQCCGCCARLFGRSIRMITSGSFGCGAFTNQTGKHRFLRWSGRDLCHFRFGKICLNFLFARQHNILLVTF